MIRYEGRHTLCRIPAELLETLKGLAVGESRTIRVAIPFHAQQLLHICDQQVERSQEVHQGRPVTGQGETSPVDEDDRGTEGRSLIPPFLDSIAKTTKDGIFTTLFGQNKGSRHEADEPATLHSTGAFKDDETNQHQGTEEGRSAPLDADTGDLAEDIHNVDCLLHVECLGVKRRIVARADGGRELLYGT